MRKLALLVVFAAQIGGSALWAQERGEMLEKMFSRMDKNGDGFIEENEAKAEIWARIGKADRNGDGKLDKTEVAEGIRAMADRFRDDSRRDDSRSDGSRREDSRKPEGSRRDDSRRDDSRKPEDRPNRPDRDRDSADKERRSPENGNQDRLMELFERFGKEGKVALENLPAPLRERLARFDKNNDKVLDRDELKDSPIQQMGDPARMFERITQMLRKLDKQGDGKVAIADIPAEFRDRLAQLDKNKDGMIEKSELADLKNLMASRGSETGNLGDKIKQMFAQFDKDGDGKLALADLSEPARDRLSRLDKNNDGQIERAELADITEPMKKMEGRFDRGQDLSPQQPKRPSGSDN